MSTPGTTTTVLMIAGMRDNACRQRIADALDSIAGVQEVDVNLYRARATLVHSSHCDAAQLRRTVEAAGYAAEQVVDERRNGVADM